MVITDGNYLLQRTLAERDPALHQKYRNIAVMMAQMLDKVETLFPDFTDHTARHALIVNDFIDRMVGEENIGMMNSDEIYLLLSSTYLHDIGMTISEKLFREIRQGVVPENYFDAEPGKKIRDAIREYHQEFSAVMIRRYSGLIEAPSPEYDYCLCQIARGHRRTDITDKKEFDPDFRLPNGNRVCLPYLAALIRLADELDIAIDRNPISAYGEHPDTPAFRQHFAVKHLVMEEDRFVMEIETEEEDVREACLAAALKLKNTLSYCYRTVNDLTPFRLSQKDLYIRLNGELLKDLW